MYETVPEMPEASYTPSTASGDPSKDWMAIVSLVLGILNLCSICTFFIPFACCLTILLTIGAIVFGILGMKSTKRTLAIVGLVLGGLGLLIQIIGIIVALVSGTLFSFMESGTGNMEFLDFLDSY